MINIRSSAPSNAAILAHDAAQAMFNQQLDTYRKITRENLMSHREVYALVRSVLIEEAPERFRFLDVACGDASVSSPMLENTSIDHYAGIDLSPHSLALAKKSLGDLSCPVELHCGDFVDLLATWKDPVDVVWVGMSLHHLRTVEKKQFMKSVYRVLRGRRLFLIWEPVFLDGEDRIGWLNRFVSLRDKWAPLTDDEWSEMHNHMRLADFPESAAEWKAMGRDAGFDHAEEILMMPNRMGRVFKYWN